MKKYFILPILHIITMLFIKEYTDNVSFFNISYIFDITFTNKLFSGLVNSFDFKIMVNQVFVGIHISDSDLKIIV